MTEVTQNPDGTVVELKTVAQKRGIQTFLQGLAIDVAVGIALVILANVDAITDQQGLIAMGLSIVKSAITATAAYVIRMYQDKSGFAPRDDLPPQRAA